jgi:hypothetical protein
MDVTALESKNDASKSMSNVVARSRAGSHVASVAASEAEVTQRLSHPALWDRVDLVADLDLVSVVDSGEGSMEVAAVVASEVGEAAVVSRTVVDQEVEVVSAIKAVDSVAVMVAEVIAIEDLVELLHQTRQLGHDQAAVATLAMDMAKARRTAMGHLLLVGMNHAVAALRMTTGDQVRVGTEVVVIDMVVREEATTVVVVAAVATWSR